MGLDEEDIERVKPIVIEVGRTTNLVRNSVGTEERESVNCTLGNPLERSKIYMGLGPGWDHRRSDGGTRFGE